MKKLTLVIAFVLSLAASVVSADPPPPGCPLVCPPGGDGSTNSNLR